MITQDFIYKAAQAAFSKAHPRFPWPKKHELEDQSDEFKRAFLMLCADINAEHEKEIENRLRLRDEIIADWKNKAEARFVEMTKQRDKNDSLKLKAFLGWLLAIILLSVSIASLTGHVKLTKVCVENPEDFNFRFTDSVAVFDEYGNKVLTPVCK